MFNIVELQRKFTKARNEIHRQQQSESEYRPRTASITRKQQNEREKRKQMIQREVIQLLDGGYSVDQSVNILEGYASPSEVARIAEYNQRRRKFLMTGKLDLPGQMVGITIG